MALFVLAALPRIGHACSVCATGREDETRIAFLVTAAFLSVLPLTIVGGLVWWLRRRSLQLRREQDRERELAEPGALQSVVPQS